MYILNSKPKFSVSLVQQNDIIHTNNLQIAYSEGFLLSIFIYSVFLTSLKKHTLKHLLLMIQIYH